MAAAALAHSIRLIRCLTDGSWPPGLPLRRFVRHAVGGVALIATVSCVRTELVCTPAPVRDLMPDIVALVGSPHLVSDSAAPIDRIVGRVFGQFERRPIRGALVELDSIGTSTTTDSAGHFMLPKPALDRVVLRIRAIGFIMRRDTLRLAPLAGHHVEVVLPGAYAFGDIEGMPCTSQRRRWPFQVRRRTDWHPSVRREYRGLVGGGLLLRPTVVLMRRR